MRPYQEFSITANHGINILPKYNRNQLTSIWLCLYKPKKGLWWDTERKNRMNFDSKDRLDQIRSIKTAETDGLRIAVPPMSHEGLRQHQVKL